VKIPHIKEAINERQIHISISTIGTYWFIRTGKRLKGIAFRAVDTDMGQALIHHGGAPFHIAGKIRINTWQGRSSAQILVDDAAPVW
jgi:hypothetical protein